MKPPPNLQVLRDGIQGYDPSIVGLPSGYVVIRQDTLEALIEECEAARAALKAVAP